MRILNFIFSTTFSPGGIAINKLLFIGAILFWSACTKNKTAELLPQKLLYSDIQGDMGSVIISDRPTVFSKSPCIFGIFKVKKSAIGAVDLSAFTIDDKTGVLTLDAANKSISKPTVFSVDISVRNNAGTTVFKDVANITVRGLIYDPKVQHFLRGEAGATATPLLISSKPAEFGLKNAPEGFHIHQGTGVVSVDKDNTIAEGIYPLHIVVTTPSEQQGKLYKSALQAQIDAAPYDLIYEQHKYQVQQTQSFRSVKPKIKGSEIEKMHYVVKEGNHQFQIDDRTGIISLPGNHTLDLGIYSITVSVTNSFGSKVFEAAISVEIIKLKVLPPANLVYIPNRVDLIQGRDFTSETPQLSGTQPFEFDIVNPVQGIRIDAVTGVISLDGNNGPPLGKYAIDVLVKNIADPNGVRFNNALEISIINIRDVLFVANIPRYFKKGSKNLGNFQAISLVGEPVQNSNKSWTKGWGGWYIRNSEGSSVNGARFNPGNSMNNDWLLTPELDLRNYRNTVLFIDAYCQYGYTRVSKNKIKVSENFNGDIEAATWTTLDYDFPNGRSQTTEVDLSGYDGKQITIAVHSLHALDPTWTDKTDEEQIKAMYRKTAISRFDVSADRK